MRDTLKALGLMSLVIGLLSAWVYLVASTCFISPETILKAMQNNTKVYSDVADK